MLSIKRSGMFTGARLTLAIAMLQLLPGCANTVVTTDAEQAARAAERPPAPVPSAPPSAVNPVLPSQPPPRQTTLPAVSAGELRVRDLLDDPRLNTIFVKRAPNVANNPKLAEARDMTLSEIAGRPEYGISRELAALIVRDANAAEGR